jgi:hypothetical protein
MNSHLSRDGRPTAEEIRVVGVTSPYHSLTKGPGEQGVLFLLTSGALGESPRGNPLFG